jgi:hypothetical protein
VPGTPVQQLLTPQNSLHHNHAAAHHHHHLSHSVAANATTAAIPAVSIAESTPIGIYGGGGGIHTPKQSLMETPLLYCNSISTPMSGPGGGLFSGGGGGLGFSGGGLGFSHSGFSSGGHISGISSLNLTDSDNAKPSMTGLMPPPVR